MNPHIIRRIERDEFPQAVDLLAFLNPETPLSEIRERLGRILQEHSHYTLYGAFDGDVLMGVCSTWVATKVWCGRYLEIDNLVVRPEYRSQGVGSALIEFMERLGREQCCEIAVLDSYTANRSSHRLYHRHGFEILGFHFVKPLGDGLGQGTAA